MPIIDLGEAKAVIGRATTCTDRDNELINLLLPMAEANLEKYLNFVVVQKTFTEFYPHDEELSVYDDDDDDLVYVGDKVYVDRGGVRGRLLNLNNVPVRSITSVNEDAEGFFGQVAGSFAASTLLTSGTDYYLALQESGISWSGALWRRAANWPVQLGSIKVVYVAGFTAAELADDYADIRWGALRTFSDLWSRSKALHAGQRSDAIGSESIGGGVSASYVNEQLMGLPVPDDVANKLHHYLSYDNLGI